MLEQAERTTCLVTSQLARHVVLVVSWRVVTWRNKWNLGMGQSLRKLQDGGP